MGVAYIVTIAWTVSVPARDEDDAEAKALELSHAFGLLHAEVIEITRKEIEDE